MKNVLKNILFSFCFTEWREIRAISPFIFMRAKMTVDGNRGGEDGGKKIQRGLSPEKRRKGER